MTKRILFFIIWLLPIVQIDAQSFDVRVTKSINNIDSYSFSRFISKSDEILCVAIPVGLIGYGLLTDNESVFYEGVSAGLAVGMSAAIMWGSKRLIKRDRPFITHPDDIFNYTKKKVNGYSFPSGHTSTAFALATSLTLIHSKWYVAVPSYLFATSVAYSRMNLGVHYFYDVLAGSLLGAGCAYLAHISTKWFRNRYGKSSSTVLNMAPASCFLAIAIPF